MLIYLEIINKYRSNKRIINEFIIVSLLLLINHSIVIIFMLINIYSNGETLKIPAQAIIISILNFYLIVFKKIQLLQLEKKQIIKSL